MASYRGELETVRRLLDEDPDLVNSRNSMGRFPLEMAAQTGQLDVVKFLLEKGADVNMNIGGATALHMAAIYGGITELITLLLEAGADINARAGNRDTPLNLAVIGKQKEIAELLLDKGGEINLENQDFTQLLYISASGGIQRIADMALKEKVGKVWSEPKLLDGVINSEQSESVHSLSQKGTLYFRRGMELFSSKQLNGVFQEPERLDISLQTGSRIMALFVAPDESFMILESFGGEGGYGDADLYACYKQKDDSWSEPVNLCPKINTGATERFPSVSPDGKYLFFLRISDGSDFYWVSAKIIEELK